MRYLERNTEGGILFVSGGAPPPTPPGWGSAPVFLQCHQVPIDFTNQYTKLNTNRAITLVHITILVWADRFLLIFLGSKTE